MNFDFGVQVMWVSEQVIWTLTVNKQNKDNCCYFEFILTEY